MNISIKVSWLEEFIEKVSKAWGQVAPAMDRWIKKAIFYLEWEAITKTPVDTGTLRNSYKEKFSSMYWVLYNIRKYGVYVHEGTKFIRWNPFLTDTAKREAGKVSLIMNKEMYKYLSILK